MRRWAQLLVVLAAALGALAPPAFAARSWNPPIELSTPGADAWIGKEVPALSVTPDGTALTAWREGDLDSSVVKATEKPRGAPALDPQTLGGGFNPPSIATTVDGHAYVAWVGGKEPGRGDDVMVAERIGGGGFGTAHLLDTDAEGYGQPGTAVAADARGDAVVVYTKGPWADQQLWSVRRTPDGIWHDPLPVGAPIGEAVWRLHAGMSETGEAIFSWLSWNPNGGTSAWTAIQQSDGPAYNVERMHKQGDNSTMPSLAVDHLGNAIVAWIEESNDPVDAGSVEAAVRGPGLPFGPPIKLGGSAFELASITAGLSNDGHAVVTWQKAAPLDSGGTSLGPAMAAAGLVPAGVFTPPEQVSTSWLVDSPLTMAVDPVGNAAFFWPDWDTGEQRVVRRSVGGLYGNERAVVTCPRQRTYPIQAAVDPLGNATLLWNETTPGNDDQGLMLSQDEPSAAFSPDPCPAPPPALVWTPKDPEPGQSVTFDATGFRNYYGNNLTTFRWDLDGDGIPETDTGETPTASHVFDGAGEQRILLEISSHSRKTGDGGGGTYPYAIRVGSPPDPPNEYPAYDADPRPSDLPDEDPWPIGARIDPNLPPAPGIPDGGSLGLPGPGGVERPASGLVVRTAGGIPSAPRLLVEAAGSARAQALARTGLAVRLVAGRRLKVRLRLFARRGSLVRPVTTTVPAGRAVIVRLRASAAGRRLLRRRRVHALTLEARSGSTPRIRQQIRVR